MSTNRPNDIAHVIDYMENNEAEVYATEHDGRVVLIMDKGTASILHEMAGSTTIRGAPRVRTNLVYNKMGRAHIKYPDGLVTLGAGIFRGTLKPEDDLPLAWREGI